MIITQDFVYVHHPKTGGSFVTSFAVATTKTGARFSAIQVRNEPKLRVARGSESDAAKPFSISSIQSTHGASDSATATASRITSSGLRAGSPKAAARSARSSGNCHSRATAFAQSDLPQPCTPSSSRPRGAGSPKRRASSPNACLSTRISKTT